MPTPVNDLSKRAAATSHLLYPTDCVTEGTCIFGAPGGVEWIMGFLVLYKNEQNKVTKDRLESSHGMAVPLVYLSEKGLDKNE